MGWPRLTASATGVPGPGAEGPVAEEAGPAADEEGSATVNGDAERISTSNGVCTFSRVGGFG